ncbi:MAG: YsnF/AvaK domain-containing protein [Acidobacteriota bacterium]|nr:YsnF/AvaK domain-containing protein [Acidobacteriota bacterium]
MSKTVVGVFQDYTQAEQVARQLENQGFSRSDVSVVANDHTGAYSNMGSGTASGTAGETAGNTASGAGTGAAIGGAAGLALGLVALAIPGIGPIIAMGPLAAALTGAGIGAAAGGLIGAMTSIGVPEADAQHYAGRVKEGEALVLVKTSDDRAHAAADLLENFGAENVDEQDGSGNTARTGTAAAGASWAGSAGKESARSTAGATTRGATTGKESGTIPIVKEELEVGKRQVARGGVRVFSHMVETPVEEKVNLREEHVKVERRPVNRDVTQADMANFKEGTIEVRETAEEPVVGKRARVVEEVVVGKEAIDRTETVRGTVRHTEVNTEKIGAEHFQKNYASTGKNYDTYAPAYQYGSELANNPKYRGKSWSDVESSARTDWEKRGEGTWDSFKDSVRHGWDKVTGNT